MRQPRNTTEVIIKALEVLAVDMQSYDGITNTVIWEARDRLEELLNDKKRQNRKIKKLTKEIKELKAYIENKESKL